MRARRLSAAALLTLLLLGHSRTAPAAPSRSPAGAPEYSPGRLFIKFRAGGAGADAPGLRAVLGSALDSSRPLLHRARPGPQPGGLERLFELRVPADADVPRLAARLSRLEAVEYAEPVWIDEMVRGGGGVSGVQGPAAPQAMPNDPSYTAGMQLYLDRLQVESAWDLQTSQAGTPRPVIAIVDGGTDWQHEDLLANIWTNPGEIAGNGLDDDGNGFVDDTRGWNFSDATNNPRGSSATPGNRNHGTHTAGLAAAVTHNGVGVASASWNPLLMPINVSGATDGQVSRGYEGLLYAAENGADIASLSWGGFSGSQAGQDIVDFATAQGTLVVSAAGNNNGDRPFYPAAYRGVIAVANVTDSDVRYGGPNGSNYGGWLDVAAPGANLYSTIDNGTTNAYGYNSGTSMSCPVAAAVAALIKAQHPAWGPLKVGEQLRVSCDNINAANPGFEDRLGKGRVNALRALTVASPALRVTSWGFADGDGDGRLEQGENVVVTVTVHNYQDAVTTPSYALSAASPWVTITDGAASSASVAEDGEVALPGAFAFTVSPNAPPGTRLDLRLDMTAAGYSDFQFVSITLEPVFATHDINHVAVSLTTTAGIGWVGFPDNPGEDGDGFRYLNGSNLLFEGALLMGTGPGALSDAARDTGERTDFAPSLHGAPRKSTPGVREDQEIRGAFTDSTNLATPLGVRVDLASWAHASAPYDDFVIVGYDIQNRTGAAWANLRVGVWFDWDIDESHYDTNRAAYDAARRLGYAWDNTAGLPYVGVRALSGSAAAFSAIRNDGVGMPWSLNDSFSKAEKWDVLEGGTGVLSAGPADISFALSSGPYAVPAGAHALVYYALVAGASLADLQAHADRALELFGALTTSVPRERPADLKPAVVLGPAAPNPFTGSTRFALDVHEAGSIAVEIYDAGGRRITTLALETPSGGRHTVAWNGRDAAGRPVPSGTYYARLRSGTLQQVRSVVVAR